MAMLLASDAGAGDRHGDKCGRRYFALLIGRNLYWPARILDRWNRQLIIPSGG